MPIYEYACTLCGFELEKLQKLNDPLLKDCPSCNEAALKKKISVAGFRLKGSGWYETDFKRGNKRNLADSSDTGATTDSAGSDKSDSSKKDSSKKDSSKKDSSSTPSATD